MTYGVAWTSGNVAYLMADTLRTQGRPAEEQRTSLNELQRQVGRDYVEESLLKISTLRPGVACTIAGDVRRAFETVDFLRQHALLFNSPAGMLEALNNSLGPDADPEEAVALLIAWSLTDAPAQVVRWDSRTRNIERGDLLQIGSLQDPFRAHNAVSLGRAVEQFPDTPEAVLTIAVALMQAYCVHDDLVAQNVGGAPCALYVQRGQTVWQPDTVSLFLDGEQLVGYTTTLLCDDALVVSSPFRDSFCVFINNWNGGRAEWARQWHARWGQKIEHYVPTGLTDCRHWAFIQTRQRVLTVFVVRDELARHHAMFEVHPAADHFAVNFQRPLAEYVFRAPHEVYQNGPGFDFHAIVANPQPAGAPHL